MTRTKPPTAIVGLPTGVKEAGKRVDFKPNDFALLIETKQYRVAWSRAMECPCANSNSQTDQPDPNCPICSGTGWLYFQPDPDRAIEDESSIGELDTLQERLVSTFKCNVIGAVMQAFNREDQPYTEVGSFPIGDSQVTVRAENKLAFRDRLIALDVTTPFYERIKLDAQLAELPTRYPVTGMNYLRDASVVYRDGLDFQVEDDGRVTWLVTPPPANSIISAHYNCHPTYIVVDHPHINRTTIVKAKTANPRSPRGTPADLPVQARVRYEWLTEVPTRD